MTKTRSELRIALLEASKKFMEVHHLQPEIIGLLYPETSMDLIFPENLASMICATQMCELSILWCEKNVGKLQFANQTIEVEALKNCLTNFTKNLYKLMKFVSGANIIGRHGSFLKNENHYGVDFSKQAYSTKIIADNNHPFFGQLNDVFSEDKWREPFVRYFISDHTKMSEESFDAILSQMTLTIEEASQAPQIFIVAHPGIEI